MPKGLQGFQKGHGRLRTDESYKKTGKIHKGNKYCLGKHWKLSEEIKKRMSIASKGKKHTEETKKIMSLIVKKRYLDNKIIFGFQKGNKISLGRHFSKKTKLKMSLSSKGKPKSKEARKKISGYKNHNWKGGITPKNKKIRQSIEFRLWRNKVFTRDNYTCWICEIKGKVLHPHHLRKFSDYPKLRFNVDNGLTLCEFCHKIYTDFGSHRSRKNHKHSIIYEKITLKDI